MATITTAAVFLSLGLLLAVTEAQLILGSRPNAPVISRKLQGNLANAVSNLTRTPNTYATVDHLPTDFELFDPPNLYLYHDYVSQGLPKFMTDFELSTGTQRAIFILHWSVRYFLVIALILGMLQ